MKYTGKLTRELIDNEPLKSGSPVVYYSLLKRPASPETAFRAMIGMEIVLAMAKGMYVYEQS